MLVLRVDDVSGVDAVADRVLARTGASFVQVRVATDEPARALPPRDGVANKNGFRTVLGLETF